MRKPKPVRKPGIKSKTPAAPAKRAAPRRAATAKGNGDGPLAEPVSESASGMTEEASRQAIRLSFLIHDVSRMRRAAYDELMRPYNFTRARWWVLAHLSRHDGMMQSQLADVLEVGKASLGAVVEQLERSGLVERRSDPSDKRAKRVYLTRTAQSFIKKMTIEEDQFNQRALRNLGDADRDAMIRMLLLIKDSLSQMSPSAFGVNEVE